MSYFQSLVPGCWAGGQVGGAFTVLLGVLSELTAAGAASPANNRTGVWVAVPDAEAMGKIGLNPGYPLIVCEDAGINEDVHTCKHAKSEPHPI